MKPKKIRTLKDVELGKWYQSGSYIFQFIEDNTEGHLRGKILVNVEWSYKTQVSVPTKTITGQTLWFSVRREGDTYSFGNERITEFDIDRFVKEQEAKLEQLEAELANRVEKMKAMYETLGIKP